MYTAYDRVCVACFQKESLRCASQSLIDDKMDIIMHRLAERPLLPIPQFAGRHKEEFMSDNGKFLLYTNTIDFKLVDKRDIALFQYNHEVRCWEAVVAGCESSCPSEANHQE